MVGCISFINTETTKRSTGVLESATVNQELKPLRNEEERAVTNRDDSNSEG